ncbi:MAG TPA: sulfatase-like hydrolase/transferase, partial [Chloroflexota bacterium]|nr:sulfatase-like hydrolase/transferase [Chloroflexota bacterium]
MLGRPLRGVLWLALAAAACSAPPPAPPPAARHLVLVTIDTLRADRLGCYGSRNVATPHLDRLAAAGAMAVHATVHVPLTRPSHISIFTGLLPAEHGIRDNVSPTLAPEVPTLAPMLKAAGFRTGAFVSSIVLSRQSGLNRGFDEYSDRFEIDGDDARFLNTIQRTGDVTMKEALAWIQSAADSRFFAWIHLYDPHDPYEPPEPYASRYADRPYDGEVAWSDELVG